MAAGRRFAGAGARRRSPAPEHSSDSEIAVGPFSAPGMEQLYHSWLHAVVTGKRLLAGLARLTCGDWLQCSGYLERHQVVSRPAKNHAGRYCPPAFAATVPGQLPALGTTAIPAGSMGISPRDCGGLPLWRHDGHRASHPLPPATTLVRLGPTHHCAWLVDRRLFSCAPFVQTKVWTIHKAIASEPCCLRFKGLRCKVAAACGVAFVHGRVCQLVYMTLCFCMFKCV